MSNPSNPVPLLGLAHFTFLNLPPMELVRLAAGAGFARVGLRLHPVAAGALCYDLPIGSAAMREVKAVLNGEGVSVYDIETVVIDSSFNVASLQHVFATAFCF